MSTPQDVVSSLDAELAELKQTTLGYTGMVKKYGGDPTQWPTSTHWYRALADHRAARDAALALIPTPPVPPDPPDPPDPTPPPVSSDVGLAIPATLPVALMPASTGQIREVAPGQLQAAFDQANPGDQILLAQSADYPDRAVFQRAGVATKPITLTAKPGYKPVLRGRVQITGDYIRLMGLRWRGRLAGVSDGNDVFVYPVGAGHVNVIQNEFRELNHSAIFVDDMTQGAFVIAGCTFYDIGAKDNLDHCVYLGHCAGAYAGYLLCEGNPAHLPYYTAYGVQLYPQCQHALVEHVTTVNVQKGLYVIGGNGSTTSGSNTVRDSIGYSCGDYIVNIYNNGTAPNDAANVYGSQTKTLVGGSGAGSSPLAKTNVQMIADPGFVDRANRDYRLAASSPLKGKGTDGSDPGCYI